MSFETGPKSALLVILWGIAGVAANVRGFTAAAAPAPILGPGDLALTGLATGGPGCPSPDRLTTVLAADASSFVVLFDRMQLTLATVNTRGYVYLDKLCDPDGPEARRRAQPGRARDLEQ